MGIKLRTHLGRQNHTRSRGRRLSLFRMSLGACCLLFPALTQSEAQTRTQNQTHWPFMPEQRSIQVRDPSELPKARIPDIPAPNTVSDPQLDLPEKLLSLDEAIRISLQNSDIVRVLAGVTATNSGRTIYDVAISNTLIDQRQAVFDPTLDVTNSWNQFETPLAVFGPGGPPSAAITGTKTDNYNLGVGLGKQTVIGGRAELGVNTNPSTTRPGVFPLNPSTRSSVDLSYTQPLLQGGGYAVNMAPIVLARIDTERSFFQFKDIAQENVRGVIDAYWNLVFARVDTWARGRQVEQAAEAYRIALGRQKSGVANVADVAQARVTLANFRSSYVNSDANLIQREAALRNLLGLPPSDGTRIIPTTPPSANSFQPNWSGILEIASERRPDLVELKLIIEADQQLLLQARNQANPRLDAVALYRWNGLEGETTNGLGVSSNPGQFTDWTLGVNFSVPLGLRQGRAGLRRQELVIARDRANLDQGLHNAAHLLASNVRFLSQLQEQYVVLHEARLAAEINLKAQLGRFRTNQALFLNVLLAITDWGNSVSGEANALTQYNTQLANLERQSGTILETHGVTFYEERFNAAGPLGRWRKDVLYPRDLFPTPNTDQYPQGDGPADDTFNLKDPAQDRRQLTPEEMDKIQLPPNGLSPERRLPAPANDAAPEPAAPAEPTSEPADASPSATAAKQNTAAPQQNKAEPPVTATPEPAATEAPLPVSDRQPLQPLVPGPSLRMPPTELPLTQRLPPTGSSTGPAAPPYKARELLSSRPARVGSPTPRR